MVEDRSNALVLRADRLAQELAAALAKLNGGDEADTVKKLVATVVQPHQHRPAPRPPPGTKGPAHRAAPRMKNSARQSPVQSPRRKATGAPWCPGGGEGHIGGYFARYKWASELKALDDGSDTESTERFMTRLARFTDQRRKQFPSAHAPRPDQHRPWIPSSGFVWGEGKGYPLVVGHMSSNNRYSGGVQWAPRAWSPPVDDSPPPSSLRAPAHRAAPPTPRRPAPPSPRSDLKPPSPRSAPSSPAAVTAVLD